MICCADSAEAEADYSDPESDSDPESSGMRQESSSEKNRYGL